jgi:hypothetical protein
MTSSGNIIETENINISNYSYLNISDDFIPRIERINNDQNKSFVYVFDKNNSLILLWFFYEKNF